MQREPFDPLEFEHLTGHVPWVTAVHALVEVASTNDEAARLARAGAPEGTVVVADYQTAGRGRLGRAWTAEPGTSLLASWLIKPPIPPERRPLLSFATAVAVAAACEAAGVLTSLKWPNDVLVAERKLAGILTEMLSDGTVVIGVGLNVRQDGLGLPLLESATSLLLERSRPVSRAWLLGSILSAFAPFAHAPAAALETYRARCATVGRVVRVERPGGDVLEAEALRIDDDGALIVRGDAGEVPVVAGDVVHVR